MAKKKKPEKKAEPLQIGGAAIGAAAGAALGCLTSYMFFPNITAWLQSNGKSDRYKYLIGTKWLIGYDIKTIRAFVTPQIGLANFRTISSYNFNDPNSQNQTGHKVAQRNLNPVFGLEVGTEIVLNNIFKKKITGKTKHRLLLSASFLQGFGDFKYCNVNT
jgi:hypothetical protein